jgi:hypothetical protein
MFFRKGTWWLGSGLKEEITAQGNAAHALAGVV